jgi:hypothetical protein
LDDLTVNSSEKESWKERERERVLVSGNGDCIGGGWSCVELNCQYERKERTIEKG